MLVLVAHRLINCESRIGRPPSCEGRPGGSANRLLVFHLGVGRPAGCSLLRRRGLSCRAMRRLSACCTWYTTTLGRPDAPVQCTHASCDTTVTRAGPVRHPLPRIRVKVQGRMTSSLVPSRIGKRPPTIFSGLETRQWCLSMNIIHDPAVPKACSWSTVPGGPILWSQAGFVSPTNYSDSS